MEKSERFSQVEAALRQQGISEEAAKAVLDAYQKAEAAGSKDAVVAALEALQSESARSGLSQDLIAQLSNMVAQALVTLVPPQDSTIGSGPNALQGIKSSDGTKANTPDASSGRPSSSTQPEPQVTSATPHFETAAKAPPVNIASLFEQTGSQAKGSEGGRGYGLVERPEITGLTYNDVSRSNNESSGRFAPPEVTALTGDGYSNANLIGGSKTENTLITADAFQGTTVLGTDSSKTQFGIGELGRGNVGRDGVFSTNLQSSSNTTSSSGTTSGGQGAGFTGVILDDYIAGAKVFIDTNNNGRLDAGEQFSITDSKGQFTLYGVAQGSRIVGVGGVDTRSGAPNSVSFKAIIDNASAGQDGKTGVAVSSLSTLLTTYVDQGFTSDQADNFVRNELGLPSKEAMGGKSLNEFDPGEDNPDDDIDATLQNQIVAYVRQVSVLIGAIGALIDGASNEESDAGIDIAYAAVIDKMVNGTLDLGSPADLTAVLNDAIETANDDGITSNLHASVSGVDGDANLLGVVLANVLQSVNDSARSDPTSKDSEASLRFGQSVLAEAFASLGQEAATGRGGDISLAPSLVQTVVYSDPTAVSDQVESIINTLEMFNTTPAEGYANAPIPLDIRLPVLGVGKSFDEIVISGVPAGMKLVYFDEANVNQDGTSKTIDLPIAGDGSYTVSNTWISNLAAVSEAELAEDVVLDIDASYTDTTDNSTTAYEGTLTITVLKTPNITVDSGELDGSGKIGGTEDAVSVVLPSMNIDRDTRFDITETISVRLTLSNSAAEKGELRLVGAAPAGVTVEGEETDTITLLGSRSALDSALAAGNLVKAVFDADFNTSLYPSASVEVEINDRHGQPLSVSTQTVTFAVAAVNDTPTLADSSPRLADIDATVTDGENAGTLVRDFVVPGTLEDVDFLPGETPERVAVTDLTVINGGHWEYKLSGGSWTTLAAPASGSATLLDSDTSVRYVPNGQGTPSITFKAWDGSGNTAGSTVTLASLDGHVSADTNRAELTVLANDSALAYTLEKTATEDTVLQFSQADFTGAVSSTSGSLASITVTSLPSNGTLRLGGTEVSDGDVITVANLGNLNFTPSQDYNGPVSFSWFATTAGDVDTDVADVVIEVESLNDAPIVGGTPEAVSVTESDPNPVGQIVGDLVLPAFSDAGENSDDMNALAGIAITGLSTAITDGAWQYRVAGTSTWVNLRSAGDGHGSNADPIFLAIDDEVRFVPSPGKTSISGGVTAYLIDTSIDNFTSGRQTTYDLSVLNSEDSGINVTGRGGSTPFSHTTITLTVSISGLNDAPVLDVSYDANLSVIDRTDQDNEGTRVGDLLATGAITDKDLSAEDETPHAIAVVGGGISASGHWEYRLADSEGWSALLPDTGTLTKHALLLGPDDYLRFVPEDGALPGSASLTFRAWDQSSHSAGDRLDLSLGASVGGRTAFSAATDTATVRILTNAEDLPVYSIIADSAAVLEGNPGDDPDVRDETGQYSIMTFVVSRVSTAEYYPADTVAWQVGGAISDLKASDYSGTVSFAEGETEKAIQIRVVRDATREANEDVVVQLGAPAGEGRLSQDSVAITRIINDDPTLAFASAAQTVVEGQDITFTIRRISGMGETVTLRYDVLSATGGEGLGSALDSDETAASGAVYFGINETEKTITLHTVDDESIADPQRFYLALSDENGTVNISKFASEGIVVSNDASISVTDVEAGQTVNGITTYTVTVERTGSLGFEHAFNFDLVGIGENPAQAENFLLEDDRRVVFAANDDPDAVSDTVTFTFQARPGLKTEGIRHFEVRIAEDDSDLAGSTADRVVIGVSAARGELVPNGVTATIVPVSAKLIEGSNSTTFAQSFQVQLSEATDEDVVITWTVSDYGGDNAANAADFVGGAFQHGTVTIAAGQTHSGTIFVTPASDGAVERNEKYYVDIDVASGPAEVRGISAVGTIVNDDAFIGFASTDPASAWEGATGQDGHFAVTVVRDGFARSEVSIGWYVELISDSSVPSNQRASAEDFVSGALPSGRVTFIPGATQADISFALTGNNALEYGEKFRIVLDGDTIQGGAQLSDNNVATGIIANDDAVISIDADSLVVSEDEGQGGSRTVTLTIVRDTHGASLPSAAVQWLASASGIEADDATAADFVGNRFPGGTVTFAAGSSTALITFTVAADDVVEGDESFQVALVGTTAAQHSLSTDPAQLTATVTLTNDDDLVSFSTSGGNLSQSVSEDGASHAGQTITYTLTRSGDLSKETSVDWHLGFDGKTAAPPDFKDANGDPYSGTVEGTAVFAAGSATATIVLSPVKDTSVESNETFSVILDTTGLSANGTRLATSNITAEGALVNDDVAISAAVSGTTLEANDGQTTTLTFTVSRSSGDTANQATDLTWSVAGSTIVVNGLRLADALSAGEFTAADQDGNNVLHWDAGDTSTRTITVTVNGDVLIEGDEAIRLTLANSGSASVADLSAATGTMATLHDNDASVWVEQLVSAISEGKSGQSRDVTFRIFRQGDIESDLTVALSPSGASGVSGPSSVTFHAATDDDTVYASGAQPKQWVDITYTVSGDDTLESGEALTLMLGALTTQNGYQASLDGTHASASTTITNDDNKITISSDATWNASTSRNEVVEGATSASPNDPDNTIHFTLTRDATGTLAAETVTWRIVGSGNFPVTAGDFPSGQGQLLDSDLPTGSVSFAQGATTATVSVTLDADRIIEPTEALALHLTDVSGNLQASDYAVTVIADDAGYNVIARDAELSEGNDASGSSYIYFDLAAIGANSRVYWQVTGASNADIDDLPTSNPGTGAAWYDSSSGGSIKGYYDFVSGTTENAVVALKVKQDSIVDADKTATIALYSDSGFSTPLTDDQSLALTAETDLIDDDAQLTLVASDGASLAEGSDPTPSNSANTDSWTTLTFTVNREGKTEQVSSVGWSVNLANGLTAQDFSDAVTSGTVTFAADEIEKTIVLKVKKDWLEESSETVTVTLGTPSAGTSLAGGSQSAQTVIENDDVTVQFAAGSLAVSHDEGDSGTTAFTFTIQRTGDTADLASTVTWSIAPNGALNSSDFSSNTIDYYSALPTGQVTFNTGETSKTITVNVRADTFTEWHDYLNRYPTTQGSSLEGDETFTVTLSNGATVKTSNSGYGNNTPSIGTSIGDNDEAAGTILNDDVGIHITDIRTNLAEGTVPDQDGDVNPSQDGVQTYIEQSITFERVGDPRQAVSFNWGVSDATNFSNQMMSGQAATGTVSWAAGDTSPKTITFRPQGDDAVESNYSFVLSVANSGNSAAIDEFSYGTSTNTVRNNTLNSDSIPLATFNVLRDEAGVWVTNEVQIHYDAWDSQQTSTTEQYSGSDPWSGNAYVPGHEGHINYSGSNADNVEGSLGSATSGSDYTAVPATTLTFDAEHLSRTVTVNLLADGTYETREGFSLFLDNASGATVADREVVVTVADDDSAQPSYRVNVNGSTAIEGMDEAVQFTVDLGKALTQDSTFSVALSDQTAAQSSSAGEAGDVARYFEYSTDGGATWQTSAPVFEFNYAAASSSVDDQVSVAYQFDNSESGESFDSWLEFSDLKADSGYRVGGVLQGLSHAGPNAGGTIHVVVDRDGAYVDDNADGVHDEGEDTEAFDCGGNDSVDLANNTVVIHFNDRPNQGLDFSGFGADDRVEIDRAAFHDNGWTADWANTTFANSTPDDYGGPYCHSKGYNTGCTDNGYASTAFLAYQNGSSFGVRAHCSGFWYSCSEAQLAHSLGEGNSDFNSVDMLQAVSFVGAGDEGGSGSAGLFTVWIPVRADVEIDTDALRVSIAGSGGSLSGDYAGLASLSEPDSETTQALLAWWNTQFEQEGVSVEDVQEYFAEFAMRNSDAVAVQFLRFDMEWDGYGDMTWSVEGLDPAMVVAPQDGGVFSDLRVVQDVTLDAGQTTVAADIALGAQAVFNVSNGMSAIDSFQPEGLQPTFEVTEDSIDAATGIRTVHVTVTRPDDSLDDVVNYRLNVPQLTDAAFLNGSDSMAGRLGFAAGEGTQELVFQFNAIVSDDSTPAPIHRDIGVIVGYDADGGLGAFIDTDQDHVLDASEATSDNLAFDADGNDLVGLDVNRVTVRFNDLPESALDFSGFGADDRIEFNLDEMARNGWALGDITARSASGCHSSSGGGERYRACSSQEVSGLTIHGDAFDVTAYAEASGNGAQTLEFRGSRSGSWTSQAVATLGGSETALALVNGENSLNRQISFVHNPTQHIVVDSDGAYVDSDADGIKDDNESTLAFSTSDGSDLVGLEYGSYVIHFNDAPDEALDFTGFGRDDRIEIDVSAFQANGWNDAISGMKDDEWRSANVHNEYYSGSFCSNRSLYFSDGSTFGVSAVRSMCYSSGYWCSSGAQAEVNRLTVRSNGGSGLELAQFGTGYLSETAINFSIDGNGGLMNRISFVNLPDAEPVQNIQVIVDHYDNGDLGTGVGAFVDLDADGVLDAAEASAENIAFDFETGEDFVDLASNHVTVRFNDVPDTVLDFRGFGSDDKIEINLAEFAANGWKLGTVTDTAAGGWNWSSCSQISHARSDLCLSGQTAHGDGFSFYANAEFSSGSSVLLRVSGYRMNSDGPCSNSSFAWTNGVGLASFGNPLNSHGNPIVDGSGRLNDQVSFVHNPTIHVVVESGGAFIDTDADGVLDNEEAVDSNRAFQSGWDDDSNWHFDDHVDLANNSVVIKFNDAPDSALNFEGFGKDDRIEIDLSALRANGWHVGADFTDSWRSNSISLSSSTKSFSSSVGLSGRTLAGNTYEFEVYADFESSEGYVSSNTLGMYVDADCASSMRADLAEFGCDNANNPIIDGNFGLMNRISFVQSHVEHVIVQADGGWIDSNADGILQSSEKTDDNLAFDFTVGAGESNALIDLAHSKVVLQFEDRPDQALDLSQFGLDDRIEIDRTAFGVNGWHGAANEGGSQSSDAWSGGSGAASSQKTVCSSCASIAVNAARSASGDNRLSVGTCTSSDGSERSAVLATFGENTSVIDGDGGLMDRISFVTSTIHVVVEADGAFIDANANGTLDDDEAAYAFDQFTGQDLIGLDQNRVVVHFNDAPDTPLDFSGFGWNDRIEIDRSAFAGNGWHAALSESRSDSGSWGSVDDAYAFRNFVREGESGFTFFGAFAQRSGSCSSSSSVIDRNVLGVFDCYYGEDGCGSNQATLADFGTGSVWDVNQSMLEGGFSNLVSFVGRELITGFDGEALTLDQGGSVSGGEMAYDGTITAGLGTDEILIRVPIIDDNLDEQVETLGLTVSAESGNSFTVPEQSGTSVVVDDDSPQITVGYSTLVDGQLNQGYLVQTIDINNRNGDVPSTTYSNTNYQSDSLANDAGAAQSFTVTLRFQGQWELALIDEDMPGTGQGYNQDSLFTLTDRLHRSPPQFLSFDGVAEMVDGEPTGYLLYEVDVPAGTKQILTRSAISDTALYGSEAQALIEAASAQVTHVDPIIVARETTVNEGDGTATIEVVVVGGDIGDGVSVDVQTQDGVWEDRTFVVSREYATAGELTLTWSVQALGGDNSEILIDGDGSTNYVHGYYAQSYTGTVNAEDFVIITSDGQSAQSGSGLPTGTVTFADGQKEAFITVRVRTDNIGEADEDFRVVLDQPPAGVQLLGNPDATQTYMVFDGAGYAKIVNDDQVFTIKGLVINEATNSKVTGNANNYTQADDDGMAIAGTPTGLTAPAGYSLHQFVIKREGDSSAAATVDYVIELKGVDGSGGFVETAGLDTQAAGAHEAETSDFLDYTSGNYDSAWGFTWGAAVGDVTSSDAKTITFLAGETERVVTIAVKNDSLVEDAEQFRVVLTNPVALEGNDGNPGVSETRGFADFLVGDNDGTTVSVSIGWLDNSSDASVNTLSNDVGNAAIDNAFLEGTSSDWLTSGDNDYSNDSTPNDHRLVLTFTRSHADATASQAFFEIDLSQSNYGSSDMVLETGSVAQITDYSSSSFWRGTVDFAAGETTATVVFRVPDDNMIEGNQSISVTLYDAEHLPESVYTTSSSINAGAALADTAGIGMSSSLADWNTTIRDPNAYTATATVVDDDIRLWLGDFRSAYPYSYSGNYDWTPDGDVDASNSWDPWEAYTVNEGNPADGYTADQAYTSDDGDFNLTFARAGVQSGDIALNWQVVLSGTASYADFNSDYWVDGSGNHTTVLASVAGVQGIVTVAGSASTDLSTMFAAKIEGLLAADRTVENNETFQLAFSVAGSPSNILFTPNYSYEALGSTYHTTNLAGRDTMTVDVVALNDDVTYGIARASTEGDNKVTEGDSGSAYIDFDISRSLGSSITGGYHGGSSVGWRIVGVDGYDINASDFLGGTTSGVISFSSHSFDVNGIWQRPTTYAAVNGVTINPDVSQVLRININPDSQVEYGEHFTVELYNPSVGYVDSANDSVEAIIVNDDTGVLVNDFRVTEGDSGTVQVQATVIRVGDLSGSSSFTWAKYNVDTNSTDFGTGTTGGSVTMTNTSGTVGAMADGFGVQSQTITTTVDVKGDATVEDDEDFRLVLSKSTGIDQMLLGSSTDQADGDVTDDTLAALGDRTYALSSTTSATAYVTVLNDDTVFSVQADTRSVTENSGGTFTFTITRSVATPQDQTVTWTVLSEGGRNVVDSADFGGSLPSGQVTFTGGELSKTITIQTPNTDTSPEADEVFTVQVTAFGTGSENDTFAVTGTGAKGVVVNDDAAIYINDSQEITQIEGSGSSTQYYRFDVVRSGVGVTGTSTVDWLVQLTTDGAGNTAQVSDFASLPTSVTASGWYDSSTNSIKGTSTFTADNYDTQTVVLALSPDNTLESSESFTIVLSNPSVGTIVESSNNAAGKIGDDDYSLSVAQTTSPGSDEGDGNNSMSFTVTRTGATDLAATVSWTLLFGDNADAGAGSLDYSDAVGFAASDDFRASTGNFTFPAGASTYTFTIPVRGDVQWEENELFTLKMDFDRNNGTSGTAWTTATLLNDDEGFSVAGTDGTLGTITAALEGSAGTPGQITFRVIREGDFSGGSTADWAITSSGQNPASTSNSTNDFAAALTGTVTFDGNEATAVGANGQTYSYKDITVTLAGDAAYEANETYTVTLSNPGEGSSLRLASASGTVSNDDLGYFIAIKDGVTTVTEGNTDETADTTPAGTPPGTVTFVVTRAADSTSLHSTSTVAWTLSAASGDGSAVQAGDVSVSGTGVTANGLGGTVIFDADETSKEITVTLVGDGAVESAANLRMTLSRQAGDTTSTIVTPSATVALVDDDDTISIAAGEFNEARVEGSTEGGYTLYTFNVTRSGSSLGQATVDWLVETAGVAHPISAADIDSIWIDGDLVISDDFGCGTITFAAGDTTPRTIEVRVKHDQIGEFDEGFTVALSNPSYGSNLGTETVTQSVVNDDAAITLSMATTTVNEGNEGSDNAMTFTITREGNTTGVTTVNWQIQASGDNPIDEEDFGGFLPSGTVTFSDGESVKTVTVLTGGDNDWEENENFKIVLSDADIIGPNSVDATIRNDDLGVSVVAYGSGDSPSPGTASGREGDAGESTPFYFRIEASGAATATTAVVHWHIEGTGLRPMNRNDFEPGDLPSGEATISLRNGIGSVLIDIGVAGDGLFGPSEAFKVVLDSVEAEDANQNEIGASIVTAEALMTVEDDDILIALAQDGDMSVIEGNDGTQSMRFYIDVLGQTENSPSLEDVLVSFSLTGDVDAADFAEGTFDDEDALSCSERTLQYDSDNQRYYVQLDVQGDALVEGHERFTFHLDSAENDGNTSGSVEITQGGQDVSGMIEGDDYGIQIITANLSQAEDRARFVFEVLRNGPTDMAMEVEWSVGVPDQTDAGDGISADDFIDPTTGRPFEGNSISGSITFLEGETTGRFTLEASHDFGAENDERFCVLASVTQIGDTVIDSNSASLDMFAYTDGTISNDDGDVPTPYVPPAMLEPIQDPHAVG
ncbi:Calx-beta domain-containing protein [Magnetospirillum moscoviense]|uniref:Calx-beta domain-containing protein n=1 Tax=Magnetospirillum moscoviense TaxID=1437059 RepID=A0A178MQP5_9PROT|nr:Calx-beta domain-containing protein [Magnetospirillum moscoviense]OAN51297.1 hypothetical protein A6A05_11060 [Magnetospirillum moscoviense]